MWCRINWMKDSFNMTTEAHQIEESASRPNILFLICDQLAVQALRLYGGPVNTPHLERLAGESAIFDQAICPLPICSPSRASIVTGQYPHTHGIIHNVDRRELPDCDFLHQIPETEEGITECDVTTGKMLHASGYLTHHVGKWHLLDEDLSYYPDMFTTADYAGQMAEKFREVRQRDREEWMDYWGWALPVTRTREMEHAANRLDGAWDDHVFQDIAEKVGRLDLELNQTYDVQVARKACDWLKTLPDDHEPFMLTASFLYPHDPYAVPSPYYEMFDPVELALPDTFEQCETRFESEWSREFVRGLGESAFREWLRVYYASIRLVDDQIGKILSVLEAEGEKDNTIVIFTSDHGDMAGHHGMAWKTTTSFYDPVVRVPLFVRWPSRIDPKRLNVAANLVDLMPTLMSLCGLSPPAQAQGADLSPYLLGYRPESEGPHYSFCERLAPHPKRLRKVENSRRASFMVRGKGWKYVFYPDGDEYLYDLRNDPGETRNRMHESGCERILEDMRCRLRTWREQTGFSLAEDSESIRSGEKKT